MMRLRYTKTDAEHWELKFRETMSRHPTSIAIRVSCGR